MYWAAVKVGGDLRAYPYPSIKGRWMAALDDAIEESAPASFRPTPQRREALPAPASAASRPRWRSSVSRTSATCWPEK